MCGLLAAFNTPKKDKKGKLTTPEPVNEFIINQYQNQISRGQKGFGIIRINDKGKVEVDRACEGTKFLLDLYLKKSKMIIAHHRTPTSTDNQTDQTHPIVVDNKLLKFKYLVIHNGIITNDTELKAKHEKLGFVYTTAYEDTYLHSAYSKIKFNDSEALAIELALFIENKTKLIENSNSAAFIVLQVEKKTNLAKTVYFGKNNFGALNLDKKSNELRLSSEGDGESVKENKLYAFDVKDNKLSLISTPLPFKVAEKIITPVASQAKELLPSTQELISKDDPTEAQPSTEDLRVWVDPDTITPDDDILPAFAGKDYCKETCDKFKELLEGSSSQEVTHLIDDILDEQVLRINELMEDYKKVLMIAQPTHGQAGYYNGQVFQITKTMKMLTDLAENTYKDILQKEEQEEIVPVKPYIERLSARQQQAITKFLSYGGWNDII